MRVCARAQQCRVCSKWIEEPHVHLGPRHSRDTICQQCINPTLKARDHLLMDPANKYMKRSRIDQLAIQLAKEQLTEKAERRAR